MSDDKKIIFSMVGVSKDTPQGKQIIRTFIYRSFMEQKLEFLVLTERKVNRNEDYCGGR